MSKIKFILNALIISVLFSCNKPSLLTNSELAFLENNSNLIAAIFINYPPYEFVNEKGEVDGILLDYLNLLENKIDYKFKRRFYTNWQDLIKDAKSRKIDIILEIQSTESRRTYLNFTEPIFKGQHVIITKKENNNINKIVDLNGKKVTLGDEYSIEEYIRTNYPDIIVVPKQSEQECIDALINNQVDAFIGLESISNYIIKKEGITNLVTKSVIAYENELSIGIDNQKPLLASIINKGNKAITTEEKNEILNKWLYDFIKPIYKKTSFWEILLCIILMVLALSFLWSYYLKIEVKRRTKALNKAKLVAEKNNKLKTLFLQNISHEVRTPLNSIIGFASFLKDAENEQTKNKYLDTILKESSNLTNILNNMVEISELTTQKTEPKIQIVAIDRELHLLEEVYKNKANRKGLEFVFSNTIAHNNNCILSDKSRLNKSIANLLDNAVKFTLKGTISLNASIENNILRIAIKDTGIGISSADLKSIFNEFYQEEQELTKKYDGLGIGLSIANENIKSLGGKINLETHKGEGSCFTIELPVKFAPDKCNLETKIVQDKLKILITEDMKLNYLVLQKILDKTILDDKEIMWVQNGQEAIDLVKKMDFDLIFMDIKMPVLNGFDATKIIKDIKPNIVIIAQTAYAQEEDINKAKSIGFDAYLTKPIDSKALKVTLQDLFVINTTEDY